MLAESSVLLDQTDDTIVWGLVAVVGIIIIGGIVASIIKRFGSFKRQLSYINMEISRTAGEERKHWKKRRRKLWISWLPFTKKRF